MSLRLLFSPDTLMPEPERAMVQATSFPNGAIYWGIGRTLRTRSAPGSALDRVQGGQKSAGTLSVRGKRRSGETRHDFNAMLLEHRESSLLFLERNDSPWRQHDWRKRRKRVSNRFGMLADIDQIEFSHLHGSGKVLDE